MALFNSNILAGASGQTSGAAGEYQIDRSLRFNSGDSPSLVRTFGSGNRKTFTFSCWLKFTLEGTQSYGCILNQPSGDDFILYNIVNGTLEIYKAGNSVLTTGVRFRDPSAWQHFVFSVDTTQSTASNRFRIYHNGSEITSYSVDNRSSNIAQNSDFSINSAAAHNIGGDTSHSHLFDGMMAEVHFIDGQQLAPTDFGKYNSNNLWVPKAYSGTYGTNGFYLDFSDNSSNAALGTDSSGNSNTWTVNNLVAIVDEINASSSEISNPSNTVTDHLNLFDGDTSTTVSSGNGGQITWTPSSNISISKIEGYFDDSLNGYRITMSVSGGSSQTIAVDTSSGGTANQWNEFTSLSGDTIGPSNAITFSMLRPAGNDTDPGLHDLNALRINDKLVVLNSSQAGVDSLIDTPTNYTVDSGNPGGNYCTWNSAALVSNGSSNSTFSNGNLEGTTSNSNVSGALGTVGVSSGKWYYEITCGAFSGGTGLMVGASQEDLQSTISASEGPGDCPNGYFYINDGRKVNNSSAGSYGATYTDGDVIGVALDLDNSTIEFFKNGTSQGDAYTSMNAGTYFPALGDYNNSGGASFTANFGQRPFVYTPPTGYKALCTTNLDDPTIADGSTAFDAKLWTGDGSSSRAITGYNFSPDFVWIKIRNDNYGHAVFDVVRGANIRLDTVGSNADQTVTDGLHSFDSNGFTIGNRNTVGENNKTYVGWAWDAGSSTVSNTDGSITSSVRANASAGFSIVSYNSGSSSGNYTLGHGLNAAPKFIIHKTRSSGNWWVYHESVVDNMAKYLQLNSTNALATNSAAMWGAAAPTSSVFGVRVGDLISTSQDAIAYCFAPVAGYSAFGSYTGNGSADGPVVYTGMRPAFVLIRRTDSAQNWAIHDTARDPFNEMNKNLAPNLASQENNSGDIGTATANEMDCLSNGFKLRDAGAVQNADGGNYIYAAFAEHPFKTSRAA